MQLSGMSNSKHATSVDLMKHTDISDEGHLKHLPDQAPTLRLKDRFATQVLQLQSQTRQLRKPKYSTTITREKTSCAIRIIRLGTSMVHYKAYQRNLGRATH